MFLINLFLPSQLEQALITPDSGGCFKSAAKLRECALMMKNLSFLIENKL